MYWFKIEFKVEFDIDWLFFDEDFWFVLLLFVGWLFDWLGCVGFGEFGCLLDVFGFVLFDLGVFWLFVLFCLDDCVLVLFLMLLLLFLFELFVDFLLLWGCL